MPPVAVVTDTTAYLPPGIVEQNDITVVSLYIVFGAERTEPERELLRDLTGFFDEIRSADEWPTTSQPSVGDFVAAYEPLLAAGKDVVSIHISGALSGTTEAARQAAGQLEREGKGGERVRVVDSRTAAGGLGILVLVAARKAAGGADLDRIEEAVKAARRPQDLVRDRHPGVPQARWTHRRGERVDRLDVEDQADPHARGGDHPGRAGAHVQARVRAVGRVRRPTPRVGRGRLGGAARPRTRPR